MKCIPIQLKDLSVLRALAMRTYTAAFASKNASGVLEKYYDTAFAKAKLTQELAQPESFWYFAKENNIILGYLKLNIGSAQTEFQDPEGLEIERIYIDLPYINKGYGSDLIDFSISKAREIKKNYIWLGVWEENPRAISFYKKHGFTIIGTHDYNMIAEVQTDYIMRRDLL